MFVFSHIGEWPEGRVAQRIICLVPSLTETLYALGLDREVVGITKFCVHPAQWFREKKRIGGTKNVKVDAALALQPDLVIANKEENVPEQVLALAEKVPVLLTDIKNLEDALQAIRLLGQVTGKVEEAENLVRKISGGFKNLPGLIAPLKVGYLIWHKPWMAAGGDTFIHDMLERIGFRNAFGHLPRYPQVDFSGSGSIRPDVLLLSSEPYPFKEKHIAALQAVLPDSLILLADGEKFSWYGSRMTLATGYFAQMADEVNQWLKNGQKPASEPDKNFE